MDEKQQALLCLRIRSLIRQLEVLEAEVREQEPHERFTDLQGIWAGKADFSYEEIKEAEIKVKEFPE